MGQIVPDKRFNIPMALTWARIAFIPLIVGVFYVPDVILSPHVKNLLACVMLWWLLLPMPSTAILRAATT